LVLPDDELIQHGGRTYALTKMWGARFDEAIRDLRDAFPRDDVSITPSIDEA
jgi:hypothetical protein